MADFDDSAYQLLNTVTIYETADYIYLMMICLTHSRQSSAFEYTLWIQNKLYTVELQWLEQLCNHENMFETGIVRANACYSSCQVKGNNIDIFSIFFKMKVCYVFSLESPHRGDSNEYTQYTI